MPRTFHFSLPLTLAALLIAILTLRLALWQFDRAEQKRALEIAAQTAITAAPSEISQPQAIKIFQRAALVGRYLTTKEYPKEILLENRIHQKRAGYHVITPFALQHGGIALINRGWLLGDGTRRAPKIPPPPSGRLTVQGVFISDNSRAYSLSNTPERGQVRQNLHIAAIAAETGQPLLPLLLVKEPDPQKSTTKESTPALTPVPIRTNYKSRNSTIYAWQWLTFCLLTVIFYLLLSFKKNENEK